MTILKGYPKGTTLEDIHEWERKGMCRWRTVTDVDSYIVDEGVYLLRVGKRKFCLVNVTKEDNEEHN